MLAFGQRSFRQVSRYVAAPHRALWKRTLVSARESVISKQEELDKLPELRQRALFQDQLQRGDSSHPIFGLPQNGLTPQGVGLDRDTFLRMLEVSMATFLLHVEARVFAYIGQGFYTIGPCGEEPMAAFGLAMDQADPAALHYRHVASQLQRFVEGGGSLDEALLDRARGYTVSSQDPVTGGVHCAIGGGDMDFMVSSTLASQAPPAVGRALAIPLASHMKVDSNFDSNSVSVVTVGDGSVNNAHFLAALNLAEYSEHRGRRCPILFGVTDNDRCISLRGYRWIQQFVSELRMPVIRADGRDALDVYQKSAFALEEVRQRRRPALLLVEEISRRFGHAATDRQAAYLSKEEIERAEHCNPLGGMCAQAVEAGYATFPELAELFSSVQTRVETAFDVASEEPKLSSRTDMEARVSAPLAAAPASTVHPPMAVESENLDEGTGHKRQMRLHMTEVLAETMRNNPNAVYVGEDVRHGGYYLVSDKLVDKFPDRVHDFPPDETTLVGAGMGFAQAGLLPIVEIPYAKYLDCGADMFFESVLSYWLSNGRQPNGMVIRLQGFGRGSFGGNFHTHNSLHIPPGLDVVCYSNGRDYARGFRNLVRQAKAGRVVMSVDCTHLLNLRHTIDGDLARMQYFTGEDEEMSFESVRTHGHVEDGARVNRLAIVAYGNGVVAAQQAAHELSTKYGIDDAVVIDSPYLSRPPEQLREVLGKFDRVVFADICKQGQHPFAGFVTSLNETGDVPPAWRCVAASPTYNPLGQTFTFLGPEDIVGAARDLLE